MEELPELPEHHLRQIEKEDQRIHDGVRGKLADHGETVGFRLVGIDPDHLNDWIPSNARRLLRLYALPYLELAPADAIGPLLLVRLTERLRREWFSGVRAERAAALLARAESAMRDEFGKCRAEARERGARRNTSDHVALARANPKATGEAAAARLKPGPKPKLEQYAAVVDAVRRTFGEQWRKWRDMDLYPLAEALDAEQVPVPSPWRTRVPKRRSWVEGLDEAPAEFRKAIAYRLKIDRSASEPRK